MESFKALEAKVVSLVELIKDLKSDNAKLAEENAQLSAKLAMLEKSLQGEEQFNHELKNENEHAKQVVNDLLKSIDQLVETQR